MSGLLFSTITLGPSQLLALPTPVDFIPAPGPNKGIVLLSLFGRFIPNTTPYTIDSSGGPVNILVVSQGDSTGEAAFETAGVLTAARLLDQTVDTIMPGLPNLSPPTAASTGGLVKFPTSVYLNQGYVVALQNNPLTNGDGTLKLTVSYAISEF